MSGYCRILLAAASLSILLCPVQACRASQDWAAYMFNGGFEAGDHVDPGEASSEGTLKLDGIDPSSFVATAAVVTFVADDTLLAADPSSVQVLRNGLRVPANHVQLSSQSVVLNGALLPGLNHLIVLAQDVDGNALSAEAELWTGSNQLLVQVLGEGDKPMLSTPVRLELADARGVSEAVVSKNGTASFTNVPPTTITLTVRGDGNTFGQLSTTGDVGPQLLRLQGFRPTSVVENNDFSLGAQGWEIGAAPVNLIAHDESGGGSLSYSDKASGISKLGEQRRVQRRSDARAEDSLLDALVKGADAKSSDVDLLLSTSGIGSQTVSRTFNVAPGTSRIKIKYRFITSEAPAGYFGSQYNDNYSVVIRAADGESIRVVNNSMNRLGINAFDANGATQWYSLTFL